MYDDDMVVGRESFLLFSGKLISGLNTFIIDRAIFNFSAENICILYMDKFIL